MDPYVVKRVPYMGSTRKTNLKTTSVSPAIRVIKYLLFSATVIPSVVAGAMAWGQGRLAWPAFLLATFGLLLGQAGGDYLYYYFTHFRGEERDAHTKIFAGWQPLFTGSWIRPEHTLVAGFACLGIDLLIGAFFVSRLGFGIAPLVLAGGAVAIFFTPLMLRGFKEPIVFITFGPLCLMGVYYILVGQYDLEPLLVSFPVGFFITVVAYLKSARYEVRRDEQGEIMVLNLKPAVVAWMLGLAYVTLVLAAFAGAAGSMSLLGLATIPFALRLVRMLSGRNRLEDYLRATVTSLVLSISTGLLIAAGFILH